MNLGDALLSHGLLEVGVFQKEALRQSFRLRLEMLPAYPGLMAACALQIADRLARVDRIVCPSDSVPLGVAVSLQTKIPLVYSRGRGEAPVQDWVGAYDVGHPAALVCSIMPDKDTWAVWHKQLSSVGLEVVQVISVVELHALSTDVATHALLRLGEWLRLSPGTLTPGAVKTMLSDLER